MCSAWLQRRSGDRNAAIALATQVIGSPVFKRQWVALLRTVNTAALAIVNTEPKLAAIRPVLAQALVSLLPTLLSDDLASIGLVELLTESNNALIRSVSGACPCAYRNE